MNLLLVAAVRPPGGDAQLAIAAILCIAAVVPLITGLKVGLTVPETLRTWSVMETIISVVGLAGVLALRTVV